MVLGPFAGTATIAPLGTRQATSSAAGPKPGSYILQPYNYQGALRSSSSSAGEGSLGR